MPRDGAGIYTQPFPDVETATTIESTVYNGFTNDVALDLNTPRPIVAGGTGANNATEALVNLGGEKAKQVVTNYDTHVFLPGSFYSAASATAAPTAADYNGICYVHATNDFITLEARNTATGAQFIRQKRAGVWQPWVAVPTFTAAGGIVVNSNEVAANAIVPSGAIQTPGGVHARGNVVGLSIQHDNPGAVWGYSAVLGHCNANSYAVSGHRTSFRSSVGGMATFNHNGVATDNIVGVYGWVPTGGHGLAAIPAVFDRPDGQSSFPVVANRAVSVSFLGGLNGSLTAYPIGVYDWGVPGYVFSVRGDGAVIGGTFNGNSFTAATTMNASGSVNAGGAVARAATMLNVNGRGLFTGGVADPGADGSPAGVAVGYNTGSDYGFIDANLAGGASKTLRMQPTGGTLESGGHFNIGTFIGASAQVRINGAAAVGKSGVFTALYGGDGAAGAIYLGSGATKINYHDMDRHIFRTSGAAATLFDIQASGLISNIPFTVPAAGIRDNNGAIYSTIPVNAAAAGYVTTIDDMGKCVYTNSGNIQIAGTLYPVGTTITLAAFGGANTITNTQTMYLAGTAASGTRNLANTGIATAYKISSTAWVISGSGLS